MSTLDYVYILLRNKDEAEVIFIKDKVDIENQLDTKIKRFRSDKEVSMVRQLR